MRTCKQLPILLLSFLMMSFSSAQSVEKILVKSFNTASYQEVELDVNGPVEIIPWDKPLLRIQMKLEIEHANASEPLLKSLVIGGRYNLKANVEEDYTINMPRFKREVMIGGKALKERIRFTVYAPRKLQVKVPNTSTSTL